MGVDDFILKIRRADTPLYAFLKRSARAVLSFQVPIPRFLDPLYGAIMSYRSFRYELEEKLSVIFFRYPVLRSWCASVGKRLRMERLPSISGKPQIHLGDDVFLSGQMIVSAGRIFAEPVLRIGDRTFIGHGCSFALARSIEIGNDVLIAAGCSLSDYSAHPTDPVKRVAGVQVEPEEVRPIRIGNRAWLGSRAVVLPGVTVGDDAVIGAGTVVTKDVPPGCICVGNPGRVLSRTVYDPRPARATASETDPQR
jgi:acetyltransferase-like isoleucine patch superfamily enzyme